jgi:hypothetical protein
MYRRPAGQGVGVGSLSTYLFIITLPGTNVIAVWELARIKFEWESFGMLLIED